MRDTFDEQSSTKKNKEDETKTEKPGPKFAPGLEGDEVDLEATPEEVRRGEYTPTTKAYLDRLD